MNSRKADFTDAVMLSEPEDFARLVQVNAFLNATHVLVKSRTHVLRVAKNERFCHVEAARNNIFSVLVRKSIGLI